MSLGAACASAVSAPARRNANRNSCASHYSNSTREPRHTRLLRKRGDAAQEAAQRRSSAGLPHLTASTCALLQCANTYQNTGIGLNARCTHCLPCQSWHKYASLGASSPHVLQPPRRALMPNRRYAGGSVGGWGWGGATQKWLRAHTGTITAVARDGRTRGHAHHNECIPVLPPRRFRPDRRSCDAPASQSRKLTFCWRTSSVQMRSSSAAWWLALCVSSM